MRPSACSFVNDREKFSFNVLCQSIRMLKAGCSEDVRRFDRSNRTSTGVTVDGDPARQDGRSGQVLMQSLRCCRGVAYIVDADFAVQINPLVVEGVLKIQDMKYAEFMPQRSFPETLINFLWRVAGKFTVDHTALSLKCCLFLNVVKCKAIDAPSLRAFLRSFLEISPPALQAVNSFLCAGTQIYLRARNIRIRTTISTSPNIHTQP